MKLPLKVWVIVALAGWASASAAESVPDAKPISAEPPAVAPQAKATPIDSAQLDRAQRLRSERKYAEAAAIYEHLLQQHPANAPLLALQARVLSVQADAETDPTKARALRKRAREFAERSENLGWQDAITPTILATIRPDGSKVEKPKGTFSQREEVEKLIMEGETAFGRNDFAKARDYYQQAVALEPTNYTPALWTGDTYRSEQQFGLACEWYRKAIAISPNTETAHRYLGDVLIELGRSEEGMSEHVAALLCAPYERLTRQHFTEDMRATAVARGRTIPRFPVMRSTAVGKKIFLRVDQEFGAMSIAYNLAAMKWRQEEFGARYPNERIRRRSLPEETHAIHAMLDGVAAARAKEPDNADLKKWQPVLAGLATLEREGLLEAYILFERTDADLAKDYAAYRADHRDTLERYIRIYWGGFPVGP